MKKKFGFTLAEVLITLGIIGVVAAMTTPVLVANVQRQSYATALKGTVGDLENAFALAISSEGVENLSETTIGSTEVNSNSSDAVRNTFIQNLSRYLKISNVENTSSANYYASKDTAVHALAANGNRGGVTDMGDGNHIPIKLKNDSVIFIRIGPTIYANTAGNIWIDVNGPQTPNTYGRDVFMFMIGQNGTLLPMGGQTLANLGATYWNSNGGCQTGHISQGIVCTGRLVENGYEFDY